MTAGDLSWPLQRAATQYGNRTAVAGLTYAELARRVGALGAALGDLGARVGYLGANSLAHLEAWLAVPAYGGVLVDLNYRLAPEELAFMVDDARLDVLVADEERLEVARGLNVAALSESEWGALADGALADPPGVDTDALAAISYTGGTTGRPKGVMQSHANLLANAKHMLLANPLLPTDRFIHAAPMFHAADAATTFALTFVGGAHVCIRGYEPELFGRVVESEKVTVALIVPTMINMLLNHPATASRNFTAWRLLMYGASPMPVELLLRVCNLLPCDIVQLYGMTEASPLVTSTQRTDNREGARGVEPAKSRLASCGQPVVGVEVEVRSEDGSICNPHEIGEVYVRGPNIMQGYWKRPEETAKALVGDGWYKSGDVAWADEAGYLFVVDRIKDMIISGGENIYTTEVENAVFRHPAVLEVAVFGIPHDAFGEMVHAEVVTKSGTSVTVDEIIAVCRECIGGYKVPRSVAIRSDPLPKSGAGKILKRSLRDPYWKGKERGVN